MPTLELHRRTAVQFAHRHLTARLVCETSLCLLQALAKHALKLKSMHWITRECAGWFSLIWAGLAVSENQIHTIHYHILSNMEKISTRTDLSKTNMFLFFREALAAPLFSRKQGLGIQNSHLSTQICVLRQAKTAVACSAVNSCWGHQSI